METRGNLSIRLRLAALTCGLLVAAIVIFGGVSQWEMRRAALETARIRLETLSRETTHMFETSTASLRTQVGALAGRPSIHEALKAPTGDSALKLQRATGMRSAGVLGTQLWDSAGRVLLDLGGGAPSLTADEARALIRLTSDTLGAATGPIRFEADTASYPIIARATENGRLLGFVVHWRHLANSQQTREQLKVLIGSDARILIGNTNGAEWSDLLVRADAPPVLLSPNGKAVHYRRAGEGAHIGAATTLAGTPWTLLLEFAEREVLASHTKTATRLAVIAFILLLIGAGSAWVASRSLTSPIAQLAAATTAIRSGDLQKRVTVARRDELGALGEAFNEMADALTLGHARADADARELKRRAHEAEEARASLEQALGENARIAEQKRSLELQYQHAQKMEAVGRLAGGLAHDFNNILTAILSFSEFALNDIPEGAAARDDIEQVRLAATRATALNRKLLAFTRQQVLQPRVLNLNAVVRDIEPMLRRLLPADIELTCALPAKLWDVHADPGQIEQVLMNLVVNARDAMPSGGRLAIGTSDATLDEEYVRETRLDAASGPHVMLSVADTGVGMDAATQTHIFEPFFTTKEAGKGTGLGLAMVYGIVKQTGGSIWLYSEPGHGTTFKIYLPRFQGGAAVAESETATQPTPRGSALVLLVEDEEPVRRVARRILERMGHTVIEAPDGNSALESATASHLTIDLVITDLIMPKMGGRELVDRLRSNGHNARYLFMSGYTIDAATSRSLVSPTDPFLEKPFTPDALRRKVHEILAA